MEGDYLPNFIQGKLVDEFCAMQWTLRAVTSDKCLWKVVQLLTKQNSAANLLFWYAQG